MTSRRIAAFGMWLTLMMLLISACSVQPQGTQIPAATPAGTAAPAGKWETVVEAAKKEGTLVIYSGRRPETRVLLTQVFKDKFGLPLEFVPFGRGAEMLARVQAQRVAKLNVADILGHGVGTLLSFKKEGLLGSSLEPLLILPEARDTNAWQGGQLPFMDKEKRTIGMVAVVQRRILYNTDLVKENEITGYRDLLKPQFKGKIVLNDPTITGAGVGWFADLARDLWNIDQASEFLRQLINHDVTIVRDTRIHVESVARGKYSVALAPTSDIAREFIKLGAPVNFVVLKEGVLIAPGAGSLGLAPDPPHPNATTLFLNWLLTQEGQTLFAVKGFGSPSFRTDAPTEDIPPILRLGAGEKFWLDTEELNEFRAEMLGVSKQVIDKAGGK